MVDIHVRVADYRYVVDVHVRLEDTWKRVVLSWVVDVYVRMVDDERVKENGWAVDAEKVEDSGDVVNIHVRVEDDRKDYGRKAVKGLLGYYCSFDAYLSMVRTNGTLAGRSASSKTSQNLELGSLRATRKW
ncbi:hypothetical protein GH714_035327 [Hevea brasiliensis]|uniref:Uncharacterized protein n=1 Tax=Hevea brasiliensis TaxID=3981 RepID=A0A6A6KUK0_HEVBR|nr:hypothetical protein GH714_035327 [Hevea brasiliensis]